MSRQSWFISDYSKVADAVESARVRGTLRYRKINGVDVTSGVNLDGEERSFSLVGDGTQIIVLPN
ncbi:hypothetical protein HK28_11810 [Acetobacter sp. DsW_063]|nr:hypothetical protein HK28_11810 [Acetobacter sp. DsW_063]